MFSEGYHSILCCCIPTMQKLTKQNGTNSIRNWLAKEPFNAATATLLSRWHFIQGESEWKWRMVFLDFSVLYIFSAVPNIRLQFIIESSLSGCLLEAYKCSVFPLPWLYCFVFYYFRFFSDDSHGKSSARNNTHTDTQQGYSVYVYFQHRKWKV